MSQMTFAEAGYAHKKRKTRREIFLERTEKLIPWQKIERKLARHYPKGGNGRPPYPLATPPEQLMCARVARATSSVASLDRLLMTHTCASGRN